MRDLTRLASRIVMFFMQFYYRLARHSRVSYKAYIDGRTRLAGYLSSSYKCNFLVQD